MCGIKKETLEHIIKKFVKVREREVWKKTIKRK